MMYGVWFYIMVGGGVICRRMVARWWSILTAHYSTQSSSVFLNQVCACKRIPFKSFSLFYFWREFLKVTCKNTHIQRQHFERHSDIVVMRLHGFTPFTSIASLAPPQWFCMRNRMIGIHAVAYLKTKFLKTYFDKEISIKLLHSNHT